MQWRCLGCWSGREKKTGRRTNGAKPLSGQVESVCYQHRRTPSFAQVKRGRATFDERNEEEDRRAEVDAARERAKFGGRVSFPARSKECAPCDAGSGPSKGSRARAKAGSDGERATERVPDTPAIGGCDSEEAA